MILDDSMTLWRGGKAISASEPNATTPSYDNGADGSQIAKRPWYVLWVKSPFKATEGESAVPLGGTFVMLTSEDDVEANFKEIARATIDGDALIHGRIAAKIQLPPENLKRFVRFAVSVTGDIAADGAGQFEITSAMDVDLKL